MNVIRTVVVDDEPHARRTLRNLLAQDDGCVFVGECADGESALRLIEEQDPDLVLLDIEMPGMNGFQILDRLRDRHGPLVVFVTAYDEYAIRAFEVNAVDYVLKPFDDMRFREALARAKERIRTANWGELQAQMQAFMRDYASHTDDPSRYSPLEGDRDGDGFLRRIAVRRHGAITLIDVGTVDYLEAANYYVRLHVGEQRHLVRTSLTRLEGQLDPAHFVRVHRSAIVRIDRIRELQPYFHGDYVIVLTNGKTIRMSRTRRGAVRKALGLSDSMS